MNIYLRELKVNYRSLLVWAFILTGLGVLVMAFFPTIAKESASLEQLLKTMPKGLLAAFGLEKISMTDILGFYATKQYTTLALFGSIYVIMLASSMLSKEEIEKTIEFLLSKPVKRSEILSSKLLSFITLAFLFNLLLAAAMYITLEIVKTSDYDAGIFWLLALALFVLHISFGSLGFLVSVIVNNGRSVLPLALGIVLLTYFIGIASSLTRKLDFLKYLSPYKYLDPVDIISKGALNAEYLIILALINLVAVLLTYLIYKGRDFA